MKGTSARSAFICVEAGVIEIMGDEMYGCLGSREAVLESPLQRAIQDLHSLVVAVDRQLRLPIDLMQDERYLSTVIAGYADNLRSVGRCDVFAGANDSTEDLHHVGPLLRALQRLKF